MDAVDGIGNDYLLAFTTDTATMYEAIVIANEKCQN